MKIEKQVCSLEQAKRLKELGVCQNAVIHFEFHGVDDNGAHYSPLYIGSQPYIDAEKYMAAFTVAELGVMLPDDTINGGIADRYDENEYYCYTRTGNKFYTCRRNMHGDAALRNDDLDYDTPPTEAQCRADILIYLLENDLTTAEQVNSNLTGKQFDNTKNEGV